MSGIINLPIIMFPVICGGVLAILCCCVCIVGKCHSAKPIIHPSKISKDEENVEIPSIVIENPDGNIAIGVPNKI